MDREDRTVRVLAIDDEEPMLRIIRRSLEPEGYEVLTARSGQEGLTLLRNEKIDIIITDLMMPGPDGFEIIKEAKGIDSTIRTIVITAFSSIETAVRAMKHGAYDFIPKPFDPDHLSIVVRKALENRDLILENIGLRNRLKKRDAFQELIGISDSIRRIKEIIKKVSKTDGNLLITGESGVGKELIARAIHLQSHRSNGPFIPINCGALPDNLLESELFGYEKGAFTGAVKDKRGLFEEADGGTIFLDEIGNISPMMQIKILRFLQDRSFYRLGGKELIEVDVRIIAATNEVLGDAISDGRFRPDLYYRLNVIPIDVPPLRNHKEDIPVLIRHFIEKYNLSMGKAVKGIDKEAEKLLSGYNWPGNVRELENVIERAITLTDKDMIGPDDLPEEIRNYSFTPEPEQLPYRYDLSLSELEALHIKRVLEATGGNKSKAARILGIDYSTLLRKLKNL